MVGAAVQYNMYDVSNGVDRSLCFFAANSIFILVSISYVSAPNNTGSVLTRRFFFRNFFPPFFRFQPPYTRKTRTIDFWNSREMPGKPRETPPRHDYALYPFRCCSACHMGFGRGKLRRLPCDKSHEYGTAVFFSEEPSEYDAEYFTIAVHAYFMSLWKHWRFDFRCARVCLIISRWKVSRAYKIHSTAAYADGVRADPGNRAKRKHRVMIL